MRLFVSPKHWRLSAYMANIGWVLPFIIMARGLPRRRLYSPCLLSVLTFGFVTGMYKAEITLNRETEVCCSPTNIYPLTQNCTSYNNSSLPEIAPSAFVQEKHPCVRAWCQFLVLSHYDCMLCGMCSKKEGRWGYFTQHTTYMFDFLVTLCTTTNHKPYCCTLSFLRNLLWRNDLESFRWLCKPRCCRHPTQPFLRLTFAVDSFVGSKSWVFVRYTSPAQLKTILFRASTEPLTGKVTGTRARKRSRHLNGHGNTGWHGVDAENMSTSLDRVTRLFCYFFCAWVTPFKLIHVLLMMTAASILVW